MFVGRSIHKIDRKGRVSVPAAFRAALAAESFEGVFLAPSQTGAQSLNGYGMSYVEALVDEMDELHIFDEELDALGLMMISQMHRAPFDGEGRILIPEAMQELAQLDTHVLFAGKGRSFSLWSPENYEKALPKAVEAGAEAKRRILENYKTRRRGDESGA